MPEPDVIALDGLRQRPRRRGTRLLLVVGILELLTLAVLVTNALTVGAAGVARLVGPVHGLLYLGGIGLVCSAETSWRGRSIALLPGIGTLLAARRSR